jgi:outer membrane immunogenic protein
MKSALFVFAIVGLVTRTAFAADLAPSPYTKAPVEQAAYNWAGFYAGLNAGYAFGHETMVVDAVGLGRFETSRDHDGLFGGGQLGFNFQFGGGWVLGIEADMQAASIGGTFGAVVPATTFGTNKLDAFGTARGRLGYAFDRLLVYGTGGFAAGRNTFEIIQASSGTESEMHTGWTAGGGFEYGVGQNWSVKAEYLHVDLGDKTYFAIPGGTNFLSRMKFDLVRTGFNYRF